MNNRNDSVRLRRSRIFYTLIFFFGSGITIYLIYSLQVLILPTLIGLLSAYIFSPILNYLIRKGLPKWASTILLLASFSFLILVAGRQAINSLPDQYEQLKLRVNIQYQINDLFYSIVGEETEGYDNLFRNFARDELYPVVKSINGRLQFDKEEKDLFEAMIKEQIEGVEISQLTALRYRELSKFPVAVSPPGETGATGDKENVAEQTSEKEDNTPSNRIATTDMLNSISNWLIMPFVFVFVLLDDGKIKRFFIGMVPNRYFEMTLTTIARVDKAIGNYLRGTLLQCSLVTLSLLLGLLIIGFGLQASLLIALTAGIANAIPFFGPLIGLGISLLYALSIVNVQSILPFVDITNILPVTFITVLIVQLLDNTVFAPLVLGKAVNLHPLVVIFGIVGGSILFGFAGLLFAIPTIVILNVVTTTLYKQLKAYYLIY
jgi:predicted PurR-regulated permease PerM